MAKQVKGAVQVQGKLGDNVFYETKYGRLVRKASKSGNRKEEPGLKEQYQRNKVLNPLASTINEMIREHCPQLKTGSFYSDVLSHFRKEPLNNRYLLLRQLAGMEVNKLMPYPTRIEQSVKVLQSPKKISLTVRIDKHPEYPKKEYNCYYVVAVLMSWYKKAHPDMDVQMSEWTAVKGKLPEFEFTFPVYAGMEHWLMGLQVVAGLNQYAIGAQWAEGMKFIEAGTLNAADKKLLAEREQRLADQEPAKKKKPDSMVRVKAKIVR
jgi:hypothetical protein